MVNCTAQITRQKQNDDANNERCFKKRYSVLINIIIVVVIIHKSPPTFHLALTSLLRKILKCDPS
jgi:hypothetical protein